MNVVKVSIITLTYNNWRLLDKAIASVANQVVDARYKIEYLVVDDGTCDFNIDYVTCLLDKSGINYRIIVNEHNVGTVASFNNAIKNSTGDIILPLSADDEFYDNDVVNDIADAFCNTSSYIVTGLRVPMSTEGEGRIMPEREEWHLFDKPEVLLKKIIVHGNLISGASTYYHRDVFNLLGCFDINYKLLEDYPFYIKALSAGLKIELLKRKVIRFSCDGVSSPNKKNEILAKDYIFLWGNILIRNDINFLEKRRVYFFHCLDYMQKKKKCWKYIDALLALFVYKVVRVIKRIFRKSRCW